MASKSNGLEPSDWARAPVKTGSCLQRFLRIIYNPEDKSFFGRTAKRWGIVLVFYTVFYAVLALMFACCMGGLFLTIDKRKPTYTLDKSLIGANPGVAYRPLPPNGFVVKYDKTNSSHYEEYITQLEDFLKLQENENWPECLANDTFGFPDNPCFYIKLNKIYGWSPEYYEKGSLPEDMPKDLVDFINAEEDGAKLKKIWISCEEEKGENSTVILYPWGRGFPGTSYPYYNQPGYKSPVLAVKFKPQPNKMTIVRCRAWAKNIIYNKSMKEPSGYTRIQLHIEDTSTASTGATE